MPVKKLGAAVHHHNSADVGAAVADARHPRRAAEGAARPPRDNRRSSRSCRARRKKLEEAAKALEPYTPPRTSSSMRRCAARRRRARAAAGRRRRAPGGAEELPGGEAAARARGERRGHRRRSRPRARRGRRAEAGAPHRRAAGAARPTSAPRPATAENILGNARAAASTPAHRAAELGAHAVAVGGVLEGPVARHLPVPPRSQADGGGGRRARGGGAAARGPPGRHPARGERVAILAGVRESKAKVEAELDGMPFVKHTLALRLRHDSLRKNSTSSTPPSAPRAATGRANSGAPSLQFGAIRADAPSFLLRRRARGAR